MATTAGFVRGSRTSGYVASHLWSYGFGSDSDGAWFSRYDTELMIRDPRVILGLEMLYAPVAASTYAIECADDDAGQFITDTVDKFWQEGDLHKALGMLSWGSLGGETVYDFDEGAGRDGQWEYVQLKDFHLDDTLPLQLHGNLAGVRVSGLSREGQYTPTTHDAGKPTPYIDLLYPSSFWVANRPRHSSLYGQSRLAGAWKPWKEKRGKHGAIDIRKGWMLRCAFRGAQMRFPEGFSANMTGDMVPNQDVAREIIELTMAGHGMCLPNAWDQAAGRYQWDWIEAKMGEDNHSILKYTEVLDKEILEGIGIPPEVLEAPEVGGGWSGRSIPMLPFLASEDYIAQTALRAFCRQVVRPLVAINYGPGVRWRVRHNSLLPKAQPQQAANPGIGATPDAAQQPPQAPEQAPDTGFPELGTTAGLTQQPSGVAQPENVGMSLAHEEWTGPEKGPHGGTFWISPTGHKVYAKKNPSNVNAHENTIKKYMAKIGADPKNQEHASHATAYHRHSLQNAIAAKEERERRTDAGLDDYDEFSHGHGFSMDALREHPDLYKEYASRRQNRLDDMRADVDRQEAERKYPELKPLTPEEKKSAREEFGPPSEEEQIAGWEEIEKSRSEMYKRWNDEADAVLTANGHSKESLSQMTLPDKLRAAKKYDAKLSHDQVQDMIGGAVGRFFKKVS